MNIVLDIETVADPKVWERPVPATVLAQGIRDDFKPETVERRANENAARWRERAPLDWRTGRIVAIALRVQDGAAWGPISVGLAGDQSRSPDLSLAEGAQPSVSVHQFLGEPSLLAWAWALLAEARRVIGFAVREFDLPFLMGRAALTGVQVPKWFDLGKYRVRDVVDWMEILSGWSPSLGWSLAQYADWFDLPHQPFGRAEDVAGWYNSGDWHNIVERVAMDVATVCDLHDLFAPAFLPPQSVATEP